MGYYNILFIGKSQDSNSCVFSHTPKNTLPILATHPLFFLCIHTYTNSKVEITKNL